MNKFLTKSISAACIALMLSFSSCISENRLLETPDVMTVSLSVDMAQPDTRLASRPIAGEEVGFTSGDLYFTTVDGVILQRFQIVASGAPALGPNRTVVGYEINRTDIMDNLGVRLSSVPGDAAAVVVVGNTGLGVVSGNIANAGVIDILSQYNKENVNLFGRDVLSPPISGVSTGNNVLLTPTVARIEIESIRGMGQIRSFRVEGIFIDNVYRHARANGTVFPSSLVSSGLNWTMFNDNGTEIYATSPINRRGILFDWFTGGGIPGSLTPTNTMTVTPHSYNSALATNFVWGYQVFASATTLPRIVIRLRDVVVVDENGIETTFNLQFVTVNHFEVSGTPISGMSGGNVYSIAITFDETDLRL